MAVSLPATMLREQSSELRSEMNKDRRTLSILIAEDDEAARSMLVIIVAKKYPDAAIYSASDGSTGLEYFKKHLPDIAITDVIMPGMNGLQMAREIKSIKADTKLIVLTGLSDLQDSGDFDTAEVIIDHRILKPVYFEKLFAAIDQCIADIYSPH